MTETMVFRPVPVMKPRKEPRIIPTGVKMIPRIRPTIAPRSAWRLPPVSLVKYIGTK